MPRKLENLFNYSNYFLNPLWYSKLVSRKIQSKLLDSSDSDAIYVVPTCDVEMDPPWFSHDWSARTNLGLTEGLPRYLEVIEELGSGCTLYVEGCIVDEYSDYLSQIKGHEIGSHGYQHEAYSTRVVAKTATAQKTNLSQRRQYLSQSLEILRKFTGQRPRTFRAPMLHIDGDGMSLLEEQGIETDSSICNHFEGKYHPYHPVSKSADRMQMRILEIPVTVDPDPELFSIGVKSPFNLFFHPERRIRDVTRSLALLKAFCGRLGVPTVICVISHVWEFSNTLAANRGFSSTFPNAMEEIESNFEVKYCDMTTVSKIFSSRSLNEKMIHK